MVDVLSPAINSFAMKSVKELNAANYARRKAEKLWLNREQRLRVEEGPDVARAYGAWVGMKSRTKSKRKSNRCYKGIKVSQEWSQSFETFFADMGPCAKGLSLDRINTLGNYEKGNCRWADAKTQCRNQRRNLGMTVARADAIRSLYRAGGVSQQKIAELYGCSQVRISQIILKKIWVK